MQRSILAQPTVYESFIRAWSKSTSTPATAASTLTKTVSSTTTTATTLRSSAKSSSPFLLAGNSQVAIRGNRTSTTFNSVGDSKKIHTSSLHNNNNSPNNKLRIRGMASTQPLTQSTMPTAQELKIETPLSEIKTAPGVDLSDSQKVIVASVLDLFAGKPSLRKLSLWNDTAIFHDPLTVAEGHKQFAAQWYGLKTAFSSIQRLDHKVTSAGNPITLDLKTQYKVKGIGSEKVIDSVVDIYVDEKTGKIGKLEDKWDGSIEGGGVKHAFRKLNSISVPAMVSVPKSIEEEEGSAK